MSDSRFSGFYRLPINERIRALAAEGCIDERAAALLLAGRPLLPSAVADRMIENVVGVFGLPFGIAPNFLVNNHDHVIPMVVEEPSIVAGASGAAKIFRLNGGFTATSKQSLLTGQIQVSGIGDPAQFASALQAAKSELLEYANSLQPGLVARGGGVRDIELFHHELANGANVSVLHLHVDTCDAMGANIVNTMCEALAPRIRKLAPVTTGLCILSNLADKSLVTASGTVPLDALGSGNHAAEKIRDAIVLANDFANADPYRAATHNKGIMNGIDALAIATGNDWRAIEAGAHAYAACDGGYHSLTNWSVSPDGSLRGELTLPLKVGIVGGSLQSNPGARLGLAISGASSAAQLAELMAATGLAQNFAALRALVSDGIQKGHMTLHARSVAVSAGVPDLLFDDVVSKMVASGEIKAWKAKELANEAASDGAESIDSFAEDASVGSAAGKVILLGEHAVVYGRHALALPLADAVTVAVKESKNGMSLAVPDWNLFQSWQAEDNLSGAAAVVDLVVRELGVNDRDFEIHVKSDIPIGMGLGSSAAFAVAVIRAFSALLKISSTDEAINELAFRCEEITHGTPSGIDNLVATFARPVLFHKGDRKHIEVIDLLDTPPLVIASSGSRGVTKDIVAAVRKRYEKSESLYARVFDDIDSISLEGASALKNRDYEQLGSLMNVCHGLLNAIQVSTPELEQMIEVARRAGAAGAKLTGAGGGGSIVALCPDRVSVVAAALREAGYHVFEMDFPTGTL